MTINHDASGMGRRARKLSTDAARLIREMHLGGRTMRELGELFGVNHGTIAKVVQGETYKEEAAWPEVNR